MRSINPFFDEDSVSSAKVIKRLDYLLMTLNLQ